MHCVLLAHWSKPFAASVLPKKTRMLLLKQVPLTVTSVPPGTGPLAGLIRVIVGPTENRSLRGEKTAGTDKPKGERRTISYAPAPSVLGMVAVICELELTVKLTSTPLPKMTGTTLTLLTLWNFAPVMVTVVAAPHCVVFGVTASTTGGQGGTTAENMLIPADAFEIQGGGVADAQAM